MGFTRKDRELFEMLGASRIPGEPEEAAETTAGREPLAAAGSDKKRRRVDLPEDPSPVFQRPRTPSGIGERIAATLFPDFQIPGGDADPIIVIDDGGTPPRAPELADARTVPVRLDTLWVAAGGVVVLLGLSFFAGRASASSRASAAPLVPVVATDGAGEAWTPAPRDLPPAGAAQGAATLPAQDAGARGAAASSEETPRTAPAQDEASRETPSTNRGRFTIIVATTNETGAKELEEFLRSQKYDAYTAKVDRYHTVRVGAFESTRSSEALRTLRELRELLYKGKREFEKAYFGNAR